MLTVTHKSAYWVMPPAIKSVPYAQLNRLVSTSLERRVGHANLEQLTVVPHLRSQLVKHQRVNRCSSSMPWIRVQELSQQYWPLLLVTVMHTFLHLLLLSYLWYSPILGFRRVVLHMHQFTFFSLSSLLSVSISLQLQTLVQVLHRDIARVPSQGLFNQSINQSSRCFSNTGGHPYIWYTS